MAVTGAEVAKVIQYAVKAYEFYQTLSGAPTELDVATAKIIDAVQAAETAILSEIDSIHAAGDVVLWYMDGGLFLRQTAMGSGQHTWRLEALLPRLPTAV